MIPAHTSLYTRLSPLQSAFLASHLVLHGLVHPSKVSATVGESLDAIDGPTIAEWCRDLSHAQVVLTIAGEADQLALDTMEVLLQKPIYMCARGETSEPLTDMLGQPLPLPIGHRRGQPALDPAPFQSPRPTARRPAPRSDSRIIVELVPNPKRPGSAAHERYQYYAVGLSINECLARGVTRPDVRWDEMQGFLTLELPTA